MSRFDDFVFRTKHLGVRKVLGELEAEIMELIWQRPAGEGICVRDVYEILRTRRSLAYTTVMTTMSRLAKKGLFSVEKIDQAYIYRARYTKKEFTDSLVSRLLDSLLLDWSGAALSYLVSSADPADKEEIERILHEIEQRRKKSKAD